MPEPPADPGTPPASPALARVLRAVRIDVTPLRASREFRLLYIGQGVAFAGSMVTFVAVPYQAYHLTGSSLVVGLISLAELVPILLLAVVGGALADAVDRRLLVRITEVGMCAVTLALLANALLGHPRLWVLVVCAALAGALDALQRPSLDALVPRIVARDQLAAAAALEALRGNVGQVVAPPLAGVLIATAGLPATYGVDVAGFAVSLIALSLLGAMPPPDAGPLSLAGVVDALRYATHRQDLLGTYLVDMNAMFFGMPMALFPQVADGLGGAAVLGLLYAAPSAGALAATLTSGWTRRVHRHGRAIVLAAAAWGAAIVVFGLVHSLWLIALALAAAGAADMVSGLFRMTVWNQTIPDRLRGRLAGIEMISYTSGPALGNLESGVAESLAGLRLAIVSGGVAAIAGTALLAIAMPRLWGYDARRGTRLTEPDHAGAP